MQHFLLSVLVGTKYDRVTTVRSDVEWHTVLCENLPNIHHTGATGPLASKYIDILLQYLFRSPCITFCSVYVTIARTLFISLSRIGQLASRFYLLKLSKCEMVYRIM